MGKKTACVLNLKNQQQRIFRMRNICLNGLRTMEMRTKSDKMFTVRTKFHILYRLLKMKMFVFPAKEILC